MLKKVLIANRGEIAVRIVRACEELGIMPVAVYTDVERTAPHVRMAREAYSIGAASAQESYLCADRILETAKRAQVDAIHPGYGFLAEDADFAQAVIDAGLVWIGPPPQAMRLMGDKAVARKTAAAAAGVPVVPGTEPDLSDEALVAEGDRIGYPLLVKAAAGGGGKGMRRVYDREQLLDAVRAARSEARASFGDDRVYLERLLEGSRHIEVQVLADQFGNIIHLGERECSIQRRHQKLIEEAPSPAVSEKLRATLGALAVGVARQVGYTSAGTVEFLLDRDGNYYFLEMNTRLQVEHPITELVTGVDIVKEMLRVAAGRRLRYAQEDIALNGWAMECRVLAEDAHHGFSPSTGKIKGIWEPTGPGIRVESGVQSGMEVTPYYDSMIAKLAVWGETRAEAILRMRRALAEYRITGVKTTIPFHQQVMDSIRFQGGQVDTHFLERHFTLQEKTLPYGPELAAMVAAVLSQERKRRTLELQTVDTSPWKATGRWRSLRFSY
jgi:acetyl-CoA carboxylase biotin carboxylase subunit